MDDNTPIPLGALANRLGIDPDRLQCAVDELRQHMAQAASADETEPPAPSSNVVAFPVRHRQRWINGKLKQAAGFPNRNRQWLASQVEKYRAHLTDIGVDPKTTEREARDLEAAFFGTTTTPQEKVRA